MSGLYKGLLLIAILFCSSNSRAQLCFCLKSTSAGFVLKMELPDDAWKKGTVQYKGSTEKIPVALVSSKELERHDGRPSYIQYNFQEKYRGKITGTYVLRIQGANVYESWYTRSRDKKRFDLERVVSEDDCTECLQ